jgi:Holliday junction DNA helicase RuvA
MLSFIKGKVIATDENAIVLENNGIGFEINVSSNTFVQTAGKAEAMLYTYLHVKEDGIALYGFSTDEERKMFLNLITVSGVGPKVALNILSGISPRDLAVSIASQDSSMLQRVKGIGKKTAERIILELKEKVAGEAFSRAPEAVPMQGSAREAFEALSALGLKRSECMDAMKRALEEGAATTEEIIHAALRNMSV